jgi:hypothetical protein
MGVPGVRTRRLRPKAVRGRKPRARMRVTEAIAKLGIGVASVYDVVRDTRDHTRSQLVNRLCLELSWVIREGAEGAHQANWIASRQVGAGACCVSRALMNSTEFDAQPSSTCTTSREAS